MTAVDIDDTRGNSSGDDWSPNLTVEYLMLAFGALLVLFAVIFGVLASR